MIALYIMGIQPVDMMFTSLEEAARESVGYYQSMGMSQTEIDAAVKSNAEMLRMMRLIMPGAFSCALRLLPLSIIWPHVKF